MAFELGFGKFGRNLVISLSMEFTVERGSDSVNGDNINQGSCI